MRSPDVVIVTITKDNSLGLANTLHSLSIQDQTDLERVDVLVIDGGSDTDTLRVIAGSQLPHLTHVREPDRGVYDAMNKGWRQSSARFVQFLNAGDCLHDRSSLRRILTFADAEPSAKWLVFGAMHLGAQGGKPLRLASVPHSWWRHAIGLQPQCHQACLFSRSLLEVLGGLDEGVGLVGDFDLILRSGLIAPPAVRSDCVVDYEGHGVTALHHLSLPRQLHEVRVLRMQLSGLPRLASHIWSSYQRNRWRLAALKPSHRYSIPRRRSPSDGGALGEVNAVSGRDAYAAKYEADLDIQAEWLRLGAEAKADSVVTLMSEPPHSIVEVGCGTGAVISELRQRGFGRRHYGVDFSAAALAHLSAHNPEISVAAADITINPDPFGDGPYDLILASHVIEHLERPDEFLRSLREMPHRHAIFEIPLDDLLAHRIKARFRDRTRNAAGHVQFFTPRSFRALIEANGFRIVGEHTYAPIHSSRAIRLAYANGGLLQKGLKTLTQAFLPRATGPIWRRWYHGHYAVLAKPIPTDQAERARAPDSPLRSETSRQLNADG